MVIFMVMKTPAAKRMNKVISAAEFKTKCLARMDQVDHDGTCITVMMAPL